MIACGIDCNLNFDWIEDGDSRDQFISKYQTNSSLNWWENISKIVRKYQIFTISFLLVSHTYDDVTIHSSSNLSW